MRIITWNCAGKFREKYSYIIEYKPDIFIIQECEYSVCDTISNSYGYKYLWYGDKIDYKGLSLFFNPDYTIHVSKKFSFNYKIIIPLVVETEINFNIMPVWTLSEPGRSYNIQLEEAIVYYSKYLEENYSLIIGDFNAPFSAGNKYNFIKEINASLNKIDIYSLYHEFYKFNIGHHKHSTFFSRRKKEHPNMLDYCYGSSFFIDKIKDLHIGDYDNWIRLSDHMPIIIDMEI